MRIHERTFPVAKASSDAKMAFWEEIDKHDLTYLEILGIIGELQATAVKYGLRAERHPDDPDRPGDQA